MPAIQGSVYVNKKPKGRLKRKRSSIPRAKSELDQLAEKAEIVIFETSSIFPLSIFPYTVTICPNRITVSRSTLFSKEEFPLQVESVTGARVYQHLFLASLSLDTFGVSEPPGTITYLHVREARLARRYILALIECKKNGINLSTYDTDELRQKLKQIGMVREGSTPDKHLL